MAKAYLEEQDLYDIADAIRGKNGTQNTYKPSEMGTAITNIPTGSNIYDYFIQDFDINNASAWSDIVKKIPKFNCVASSNFRDKFTSCPAEYIDVSGIDTTNATTLSGCFYYCNKLKEIDLSTWNVNKVTNVNNLFSYCTSLQKIDIRTFSISGMTLKNNVFGVLNSSNIPTDCLIIVKNAWEKSWLQSNYSWLTNIKTPDEL